MATPKSKTPAKKTAAPKTTKTTAAKTTAAKTTKKVKVPAAESCACDCAPEKKSPAAKALPRPSVTTVTAIADIGWGNQLFLRGEGGGLSWEQGVPMTCNGGAEWVWISTANDPVFNFKVVLNDKFWAAGDNHTVSSGNTHISYPAF